MLKGYYFIGARQALVHRRDDSRFVVDLEDTGVLNFVATDEYEPDVAFAIRRLARPGSVVVDIGANLGIHAVGVYRALERDCTVHALEPNPAIFELLKKNVRLNGGGGRIHPHRAAAWHEAGKGRFTFERAQHRVGAVVVDGAVNYGKVEREVTLVRVDDILGESRSSVSVMKIDVEGREPFVLEGALETIAASRCAVVHEYHARVIESVYGVDRYRALVAGLGYRTFAIDAARQALTPIEALPEGHANIVIAP